MLLESDEVTGEILS